MSQLFKFHEFQVCLNGHVSPNLIDDLYKSN